MISIKVIASVFIIVMILIMGVALWYYMQHKNDKIGDLETKLTNCGKPIADGLSYIKIICK